MIPMNTDPMLMLVYLRRDELLDEAERRRLRRDVPEPPRRDGRRLRWPRSVRLGARPRPLRS
jgi:hypothetical protein